MSEQGMLVEIADGIATVTLNRPDRMNSITAAMMNEDIPALWPRLEKDPNVRVVIFTGAGDRAFCAGLDLKEAAAADEPTKPPTFINGGNPVTAYGHRFSKPVIAAVNGACSAIGAAFVSDADISIASETAFFNNSAVSVGRLATYPAVSWSRTVPFPALMRMVLVGSHERISAAQAQQLGMVTEVVPADQLMPRAREIAGMIAANSPAAVQASKRILWEALDRGLHEAHGNGYTRIQEYFGHPDMMEGPRAMMEKRKPKWQS